ncbi:hypothetical protein N7478_004855 [Penicillium angulare]|uniref:uncharacterized protein n=1 Tax=Penicillium angulare TaxID=116970 RepID=UPI00253F7D5A|nr:uncharacterized protein N7478_004855 [Penicillium angulare]KAJ5279483.1 hypothetical protein N7478_004855 [Penicillium angulare]
MKILFTDYYCFIVAGLDDLCVRFIINLPREELESVERICFQVEEAQWFYEDFIRPLDPGLPSLSLKAFALRIFQHCPLMSQWSHYHHITAFSEFLAYKTRVPVRGAILLSQEMDEVVLVKGWKKGANWSFPRGKINKGEKDLDCAIREVYEETGFDVREANLVQDDDAVKHIEISMREQHMRLYVFRGVPRDTYFEPRTRKEISKIEWYKLSDLPTLKKNKQDEGQALANANKFYMVAPFLHPLKKWIAQQKRLVPKPQGNALASQIEGYVSTDENGFQSNGAGTLSTIAQVVPSDLPEVTSVQDVQDASSHLKKMLNIGEAMQTRSPPLNQPTQSAVVDQSKSNALLTLLRQGSQNSVPQAQNVPTPSDTPQTAPAMPRLDQPDHLAPNFFPGFPQQQQSLPLSNFMQQTSQQPYSNGPQHSNMRPSPQHSSFSPMASQLELSASPAMQRVHPMQAQTYHHNYPASHANGPVLQRQGPAPFQQTGDPHFSQQAQSQSMQAMVPPASKLPPPKLNSHSLALLGVFKNESSQVPKSPQVSVNLAAPAQAPNQLRKTSQHQDSLLKLFGGKPPLHSPQPVELSGHPVPQAPAAPADVQILQRAPQQANYQPQRVPNSVKPGQISGTVPGPMNMPQLEAIPKTTPKKGPNSTNRRNNSYRRDHQQARQFSSPITILPRPQPAKEDAPLSGPRVEQTQPQHQSFITQPQAPEPVKPFQPQILRRPEKTDYENLITAPATENIGNPDTSIQTQAAELAPQNNFDRRPSQTHAQKETLLSLFGKSAPSPPPAPGAQQDHRATDTSNPSIAATGLVSPLSSRHVPSSGESLSRRGTPSEIDIVPNRIASPNNKAFLLGYLQGVAKGNK